MPLLGNASHPCGEGALQVVPTISRLVQDGSATVKGLSSGLGRSKTQAAGRAQQWLSAFLEDGHKQARVSQGALTVNTIPACVYCIPLSFCLHAQIV